MNNAFSHSDSDSSWGNYDNPKTNANPNANSESSNINTIIDVSKPKHV